MEGWLAVCVCVCVCVLVGMCACALVLKSAFCYFTQPLLGNCGLEI